MFKFKSNWHGMSINTASKLSTRQSIKIDKCAVRCYRTLYGDIYYVVEGTLKDSIWYPISREFNKPEDALDFQAEIEKQIRISRIDEEMADVTIMLEQMRI